MKKLIPGLLSGVIAAAVTAHFHGSEYHAVARTGSGFTSLCLLSLGAFVLTLFHTSSPTYRELVQRKGIPMTPLARWAIYAIAGTVFFSLYRGGVVTSEPGVGSFCLGVAVGRGVGWLCGVPQEPTPTARRLIVGYGIVVVVLGLSNSTIGSILVPYARRDAAEVTVQKAAASGSVRTLKRALQNREPHVRRDAAVALGRLGPDAHAAVEALIETLRAEGDTYKRWEVSEVRQAAATALGQIGPAAEPAVPALIEAMQDTGRESFSLRPAAATALGEIGKPVEKVVPALTEIFRSRTPGDGRVVESAIRALGRIGPGSQPAIPTLLETLESPSTIHEDVIRQTLVQIGPTAVAAAANRSEELLKEMGKSNVAVQLGAGMALRKMGPLALPTIQRSLNSDNPLARIAAARAVAALKGETQAAAVVNLSVLLGDSEATVRLEAVQALIRIGPAAKPAVAALLNKSRSDNVDDQLRILASHVLKQIDPEMRSPPAQER